MQKAFKFFILSLSAITIFACFFTYTQNDKVRVILDDNPFNHPNIGDRGLKAHLDLLVSAGGKQVRLSAPGEGHMVAVLIKNN